MRSFGLALAVLLFGCQAFAAELKSSANDAYVAQNWSEAERLYAEVVSQEPGNGQAWYRLGTSRHQLGLIEKAIPAYLKASQAKFAPVFTSYNLAAAYALNKDAAHAYEWLENAVNAGFRDDKGLAADTDFASLQKEQRFRELLQQVEKRAHPCSGSEYQELNFWLGEWNVRDTSAGHEVGTSRIESILDGCVVLENWTGSRGGTGKSFNTIDPATKKWRQTWTDSSGQIYDFTGEPAQATMVYSRRGTDPSGKPTLMRMTLAKLPTGEVPAGRTILRQRRHLERHLRLHVQASRTTLMAMSGPFHFEVSCPIHNRFPSGSSIRNSVIP